MTAQEKAIDIYNKMYEFEIGKLEFKQNGLYVTAAPSHELVKECAKKHALIAVEEIIESKPIYPIIIPVGALGDFIKQAADYWLQVKQEIEKL